MILNPNVNVDTEYNTRVDKFTPDEGYALWRDNEEGNIDPETGEPYCYWLTMMIQKTRSEEYAPHIWAKLIDETMQVYGKIPGMEEVATYSLRRTTATTAATESHTYVDENGVEREKKGVY